MEHLIEQRERRHRTERKSGKFFFLNKPDDRRRKLRSKTILFHVTGRARKDPGQQSDNQNLAKKAQGQLFEGP